MDQLLEESMLAAEKAFQEKDFYLSYSSLNKLLWSPAAFYQIYVMGIREEKTSSFLLNGKLIHALLLDPESINKNYITSPTSLIRQHLTIVSKLQISLRMTLRCLNLWH